MTTAKSPEQLDHEKRAAARAALRWVRNGMTLGLGSGSTAHYFVTELGALVQGGQMQVSAVASSEKTEELARVSGIPLIAPYRGLQLDLTVDGADEIAVDLGLIKGRGGALLREKVLARASRLFLVIADSSKRVARLGAAALPVEVVPFALPWVMDQIQAMGGQPTVRMDPSAPERPLLSEQRNFLVDCRFGVLDKPEATAAHLRDIPGVAEHGLFLGYARAALVGEGPGVVLLQSGSPPELLPTAEESA